MAKTTQELFLRSVTSSEKYILQAWLRYEEVFFAVSVQIKGAKTESKQRVHGPKSH